jgi:hypothetical protein
LLLVSLVFPGYFAVTILIVRFGIPQPDNREQIQQGGEEEACLAVLNNFYGDGKVMEYAAYMLYSTTSKETVRSWSTLCTYRIYCNLDGNHSCMAEISNLYRDRKVMECTVYILYIISP